MPRGGTEALVKNYQSSGSLVRTN